ncbi:MAG: hypothetical protein ABI639_01080 [Thermoanaerobaculia bacterium]
MPPTPALAIVLGVLALSSGALVAQVSGRSGEPVRAGSASVAAESTRLADRVVAAVDEDPILDSDIERLLRLGLLEAEPGESLAASRRRALDLLIEQRLRLHEIDRFGFEGAPLESLDAQMEQARSRFASESAFHAELERLGLDESALRQLLARQLSVLAYVEERLGPRVFVSVDDIAHYYNEDLVPELQQKGASAADLPTLESVRESIRAVLRERRLNEEIDRWTADLRSKADVVDYLDQEHRELPPVAGKSDRSPPG